MKISKAVGVIFVALSLTVCGCAGRTANPVMIYQPGDQVKSKEALELEMSMIHKEIAGLLPRSEKTAKNAALGVSGFFLLVPLFFMDFSEAEKIEINALRQRYNSLAIIYTERGYGKIDLIPPFQRLSQINKKM